MAQKPHQSLHPPRTGRSASQTPQSRAVFVEFGPNGQPVIFENPREILIANRSDEIADTFIQLENARSSGKWIAGFAAYELGYALEPKLAALMPSQRRSPLMCFGLFDAPTTVDQFLATAIAERDKSHLTPFAKDWDFRSYKKAFETVKKQITRGDLYQVNLSTRMRAKLTGSAIGLYGALRARQPVPFGAFVNLSDETLISLSPEMFFNVNKDQQIEVRPMKGTAPRGTTEAEDLVIRATLAADPKNRAENLMIVDLLRNDISKLCKTGSVEVPELFEVQEFDTLFQMVSRIRGQLMPHRSIEDIFAALFPCGSITGAPKIAAMQSIAALEGRARNTYCGSIGWFAPDGRACFNVAIRTLELAQDQSIIFNAGGGIVADSQLELEYEEMQWKTRFATSTIRN